MSRWPSWSGWPGRLSPFGRSGSDPVPVTEGGFSYITDEDLERSLQQNSSSSDETPNPNRKSDVLVLKHRRVSYPVHFKGGSIDSGILTVGDIRDAAAEKLEIPFQESERIKLFYRGRNLKDNSRLAREEGLRSNTNSDILCVVGEPPKPSPSPTPQQMQPPTPKSPLGKLDEIASKFHTQLVPECIRFIQSPPEDKAKLEFEHKRLTESILAQVLLKLDAVETDGDPEARQRRKDLVKEVQNMLSKLDEVVK